MADVRKSPAARLDLVEIWNYGFAQWGEVQADRYADDIDAAVDRLREHPESGVDCSEVAPGYRRMKVGVHHLYYVFADGSVEIIRVIDARRDPLRHLP